MARTQRPLEILARDHNWKMGALRRTLCIIQAMESPEAKDTALFAYDVEYTFQVERYNRRKEQILKHGFYVDDVG